MASDTAQEQPQHCSRTRRISSMIPTTTTHMTAWRLGVQLGRNRRTLHTPSSYPAAPGHQNNGVLALQLEQQPDYDAIKSSMLLQASLAARVQHINATIRCELKLPISAGHRQILPRVHIFYMRTWCFFTNINNVMHTLCQPVEPEAHSTESD